MLPPRAKPVSGVVRGVRSHDRWSWAGEQAKHRRRFSNETLTDISSHNCNIVAHVTTPSFAPAGPSLRRSEFTDTKHARPCGETGVSYLLPMAPTATTPNAWALHSVTQPDNVVELRPSGSLDASTACLLHARLDALVRSGYDEIIVNCRHLQHIDAAGVAPIRHIAEIFDQLGGRLTLLGLELSIDGLGEGVLPFAS